MQGPNVRRLVAHKMSADAIPAGSENGVAAALAFLTDPGRIKSAAKAATEWVTAAIAVVRTAAEPNPWKTADDEAIAAELLRQIEMKKARAHVGKR